MKQLTLLDQINIARIDQASVNLLGLMSSNPESNRYQLELHALLGNFKSSVVGCGCIRPHSCGSCRTIVEDEVYWSEKMDELLDEARQEDRDNNNEH